MTTLETVEIAKSYRGRRVVNDVSLTVKRGEIVGLLGPNGAGKTTSFYMVVGLISPDSGKVLLDGKDVTSVPMYQRANLGVSYLPQEASVFRKLTVEDNLMAILQTRRMSGRERREKMNRLIEEMGLGTVRRSKGYVLSGGERRRVEIARSLAIDPSFLLLDEPFSGIDPIQVLELRRIILDLKNSGIGILVTDHNASETLGVTDRAYIINDGKIFRSGRPVDLAADPEVRRIYLGEGFQLPPCSITTFSRTISRRGASSNNFGITRLTCSSRSTKMITTGRLPPASTRLDVCTRFLPLNPATAWNALAPATPSARSICRICDHLSDSFRYTVTWTAVFIRKVLSSETSGQHRAEHDRDQADNVRTQNI